MAYQDLTPEEQQELQEWLNGSLRPWAGEIARVNNRGRSTAEAYQAFVAAIIAQLELTDVIPNTSGLTGSTDLTANDVLLLEGNVEGIRDNYDTEADRQGYSKAAGAPNTIG